MMSARAAQRLRDGIATRRLSGASGSTEREPPSRAKVPNYRLGEVLAAKPIKSKKPVQRFYEGILSGCDSSEAVDRDLLISENLDCLIKKNALLSFEDYSAKSSRGQEKIWRASVLVLKQSMWLLDNGHQALIPNRVYEYLLEAKKAGVDFNPEAQRLFDALEANYRPLRPS